MLLALIAACSITLPLSGGLGSEARSPERTVVYAAPTGDPTWTVDCEGGADFQSIGEAIELAKDGDWISVAPCTYHESIDFDGKTLWIQSTGSSDDTILDAGRARAVTAMYGTGDRSALVGFTIQNGRDSSSSIIYAEQSALRLQDVQIIDSSGGYAILYGHSADIELQDVSIDDSNTLGYYGAILISRGAMVADGLSVANRANSSYAAYITHASYFIDHSSLDAGLGGYALLVDHSTGRVHRSTLEGAIAIEAEDDHYTDTVYFENTQIRGNLSATYGSVLIRNSLVDSSTLSFSEVYGVYIQASVLAHTRCPITYTYTITSDTADTAAEEVPEPVVDISYNDFWDNDTENCDRVTTYSGADGNIAVDPQFVDEDSGDYSTAAGSPLIDAGLPDSAYLDPDGTTNDIGLYGGPRSVGGGW